MFYNFTEPSTIMCTTTPSFALRETPYMYPVELLYFYSDPRPFVLDLWLDGYAQEA